MQEVRKTIKVKVLYKGVKENTICSRCGKKEPDQEDDDEEFDGKSDLIIDWWDCQNARDGSIRSICLVKVGIGRVGQKEQCIYCQSK